MIEMESGFNTKKISPYPPIPGSNPPPYKSYGIFQVKLYDTFKLFPLLLTNLSPVYR